MTRTVADAVVGHTRHTHSGRRSRGHSRGQSREIDIATVVGLSHAICCNSIVTAATVSPSLVTESLSRSTLSCGLVLSRVLPSSVTLLLSGGPLSCRPVVVSCVALFSDLVVVWWPSV